MIVTLDHTKQEASDIITFFFKPEKHFQYTAGQFIELSLPHEREDDRGHKRWFTLSSSPNEELLAVTTRFASEGGSSFKHALQNLQPGAKLTMSDPMGDFVLPKLMQTPLIFVAGGIGITPFHSMLAWQSEMQEPRTIRLLYGVSTEDEIIFLETFDKAKQHATIVVSDATPAWGGVRGQISAEMILGLEKPSDDTLIYISGPEQMVEALQKDLLAAGVEKRQIVGDYFPNYQGI